MNPRSKQNMLVLEIITLNQTMNQINISKDINMKKQITIKITFLLKCIHLSRISVK